MPNLFQKAAGLLSQIGAVWNRSGGGGWSRVRLMLPGSRFDYEREAGDLWSNPIIALGIDWLGNRFPRPIMNVSRIMQRSGDYRPIPNHPLIQLWNRPNPYYDRRTLEKAVGLSLKCDGNAYIYKARDRMGRVVQLWWVPHFRILPTWPADGSAFIDGYRIWSDTTITTVPPSDVIHIRDGIDPRNERLGLSATRACIREVCTVNMESGYTSSLLRNMAVPGLMIVPKDQNNRVSDEEAEKMREKIHDFYTGDQAGTAIIAKGQYEIAQVGFSPEQLKLDVLPQAAVSRIAGSIGVAAMSLGLPDPGKTYANLGEANRSSWGTVVSIQELIDEALRWHLLPEFGEDPQKLVIERDYSHIQELQESLDAIHARTREDWKAGLVRLNEAREQLGYDPDEDGDRFFPGTGADEPGPMPGDDEDAMTPPGDSPGKPDDDEKPEEDDPSDKADPDVALKYNPNHGADGRFGSGGKKPKKPGNTPGQTDSGGGLGGGSDGQPELSEKAKRAQQNYKKANAGEQRYAEAQEVALASKIGGVGLPDNEPIDVSVRGKGKGEHGIEVKTMVSGKNDKITMKKEAVDRKVAWEKAESGRVFHTVVLDHRDRFNGGENAAIHSGHEIYYKRGCGAFRIGTMHKVKDHAELKKLLDTPDDQLPAAAKGPKR